MKKIERLEGNKCYFPMIPSEWTSVRSFRYLAEVLMTCGGGMGGSQWYEYIDLTNTDTTKPLWETVDIEGNPITLNPRFIVKMRSVLVMKAQYYTENPNYGAGYRYVQFVVNSRDIEFVNDYDRKRRF